jgi:hypothetical protein
MRKAMSGNGRERGVVPDTPAGAPRPTSGDTDADAYRRRVDASIVYCSGLPEAKLVSFPRELQVGPD